jgi:hypothetical protein
MKAAWAEGYLGSGLTGLPTGSGRPHLGCMFARERERTREWQASVRAA